jgi:hypothetical protein
VKKCKFCPWKSDTLSNVCFHKSPGDNQRTSPTICFANSRDDFKVANARLHTPISAQAKAEFPLAVAKSHHSAFHFRNAISVSDLTTTPVFRRDHSVFTA